MTEPVATLRRAPIQQRGHDRVQRVLDAADRLLAAEGAEALGTKRVAAAAGVSIGSLYHWFPDKESIAEALALRAWGELAALVDEVATAAEAGMLTDPLGDALTAVGDGVRARPGFLALWYGGLRTPRIRDATRSMREQVAGSVDRILAHEWPGAPTRTRHTGARMVVLLGDGIVREAFRLDPAGDPVVLGEGTRAIRAYIHARLTEDE